MNTSDTFKSILLVKLVHFHSRTFLMQDFTVEPLNYLSE